MATVEHCLYCFETLESTLEHRASMTLSEIQTSWAAYPNGLDDPTEADDDDELSSSPSEPESASENGKTIGSPKSKSTGVRIPVLKQLSPRSNPDSLNSTSTPASSSTSSLSATTNTTTPEPSNSSSRFSPPGMHPRRTSQRSGDITTSPLFITWSTGPSLSLRGCIGTFEALPLATGISSYALTSALHDTRFSPIALRELPRLTVSVTLLTDFEDAADPLDWELGVHGIRISFQARSRRYGACYLPDVPVEQGWDKEETLLSLMRKAGWGGSAKRWRDVADLKVVRFQGVRENCGWEDYHAWKTWVQEDRKKTKAGA